MDFCQAGLQIEFQERHGYTEKPCIKLPCAGKEKKKELMANKKKSSKAFLTLKHEVQKLVV